MREEISKRIRDTIMVLNSTLYYITMFMKLAYKPNTLVDLRLETPNHNK